MIEHRPLGETGLKVPPVVFGAAALGNVGRVITEQSKLGICGEWFQRVPAPVVVEVAYEHGDGAALEVLGRMLKRMEIRGDEVVVLLSDGQALESTDGALSGFDRIHTAWEKSCRLLGDDYHPKLISVREGDDEVRRAAIELRNAKLVRGVGLEVVNLRELNRDDSIDVDWVTVRGGLSVMRHPPEILTLMGELAERRIPILASGVFEGGFLVGGSRLDGRALNAEDAADRSLLAWRKAFVALCDGHGISPAHACVQFALSTPGVIAVVLETPYADRVADDVAAATREVPTNFWQSMKEEGLLAEDDPIAGS